MGRVPQQLNLADVRAAVQAEKAARAAASAAKSRAYKAKSPLPDAVKRAWDSGMTFGHDDRARPKKHSPGMLYHLVNTPSGQQYIDQMTAWLESQDMAKVQPVAQGGERAVFGDGDRVVKIGIGRMVGTNDYVPPTGVWGVTPWLANTQVGPYRLEIQPRVDLVDRHTGGTVRRKAGYADIRTLQEALKRQGWRWNDDHIGNIGFVPGNEYHPTVIDGPVYPTSNPEIPGLNRGVVPGVFIPPRGPNWIAALAAMLTAGAAGTASTAKGNDSVTAGADEGFVDYLRRMQPTQTPVSEPGIADAAAEVGQSTLPYYAQQMAGIAKPIHEYSKDFPEMDEYRRRVDEAIDRPVIRSGDRLMSPAEYAAREIFGDDVSPQQVAMTRQIVAGQLSGGQPDPALAGVIKNTLLTLREQGVGGTDAQFAGQTLAQREDRRTAPIQEGRYMTSPGLDANLDATRVFDILSALQTDKEIDSGDSGAFQSLLSLGSAAIAPMQAGQLSAYRNFTPNPIEARTKEALMWDDAAQQGRLAGQYRGGMEGGFSKDSSWLSNRGMVRQSGDYSNFNPYFGEFLVPQFFSGTPVLGDRGQMIRTLAGELHREVPIVPEGASPEDAQKAAENLRQYLNVQGNQFVNDAPVRQRQWNRYMDSLGSMAESSGFGFVRGATDAMKRDNYRYPTPAENALATGWKYALDPTTLATAGLGAVKALGHSGIRGLASMARGMGQNLVADQVTTEQPIAVALPKAFNPDLSMSDILSKPITHGEVVNEQGERVDPNDPNYETYHQNLKQNQEKLLGELDAYWQRYYRPGGKTPPQR